MSELSQPAPKKLANEQADGGTALEQAMAEIQHLNGLMQQDRAEIERLRAEAREIRAETRALLAGMGASLIHVETEPQSGPQRVGFPGERPAKERAVV